MTQETKKIFLILVADKDMEMAIKGVFERPEAIGIRKITYDIFSHPRHDPGCCLSSHEFLRPFSNTYRYAVVIFDQEGSGKEDRSREELELEVERLLAINGWDNERAKVIALVPELEAWVWSGSSHVRDVIGWKNEPNKPRLREWLHSQGFLKKDKEAVSRPKEALKAVQKHTKKPVSSALFYDLAKKVSLKNCSDPGFGKLKSVLQIWLSEDNDISGQE